MSGGIFLIQKLNLQIYIQEFIEPGFNILALLLFVSSEFIKKGMVSSKTLFLMPNQ